jgi:hypothetical protein
MPRKPILPPKIRHRDLNARVRRPRAQRDRIIRTVDARALDAGLPAVHPLLGVAAASGVLPFLIL